MRIKSFCSFIFWSFDSKFDLANFFYHASKCKRTQKQSSRTIYEPSFFTFLWDNYQFLFISGSRCDHERKKLCHNGYRFIAETQSLIHSVASLQHSHKKWKDSLETEVQLAVVLCTWLLFYVKNQFILEPILLYYASKCKQTQKQGSKIVCKPSCFYFFVR